MSSMSTSEWGTKNSPAFGVSLADYQRNYPIVPTPSKHTVRLSELTAQFALGIELHDAAVAVAVGHEEFTGAGNGNVRWFAEVLIIRARFRDDIASCIPHISLTQGPTSLRC